MSEHSCGSGCGCGPKASSTSTTKTATATSSAIKNGKGSGPRNMSKKFLSNYEGIRWESTGKKRKDGSKFVKVY